MIQLGAILAVIWLYRAKVLAVVLGLPTQPEARRFAALVLVGFLPALVAGGAVRRLREAGALLQPRRDGRRPSSLGGVVMLLVERLRAAADRARTSTRCRSRRRWRVGAAQVLALVPGVSRSGATIVGGLLSGLDRTTAAEFSFFLSMPTMTAAFVHDFMDVRQRTSSPDAEPARSPSAS